MTAKISICVFALKHVLWRYGLSDTVLPGVDLGSARNNGKVKLLGAIHGGSIAKACPSIMRRREKAEPARTKPTRCVGTESRGSETNRQ